jgi:hypothetical protein
VARRAWSSAVGAAACAAPNEKRIAMAKLVAREAELKIIFNGTV